MDEFKAQAKNDTVFIGHPAGLGWLSASEFWERFSYYGMQTLLVLYLVHYLLLPGQIEQVWGFTAFGHLIGWLYGEQTKMALASNTAQLYAGLVYVTPLAGGFLADRLIGRTRTVSIGAVLMVIGTFLLVLNQTFLVALLLLLVGVGCFKGNIASQVGDLYTIDDPRRADGFQIYFLGIQLAVIISPFICGTLGQKVDWHLGFLAAGVGMAAGLAIYLLGRRNFPPEPLRKTSAAKGTADKRPPLTTRDWQVVILLVALLPVLALSIIGNQEIFDAYLVWGEKTFQTNFFGFNMPITWLVSLDAGVSTVTMIGVIAFWRWYGKRWKEPDEITKIVIGVAIGTLGPLVLAGCALGQATMHHRVPLYWALGFHILNDIGFANVLPVGLALYSRAAPRGLGGIMIAVYYLHLFIGNMLVGYLGGLLGTMPDASFWLLHVGLMAISAVLLLLTRLFFAGLVAPSGAAAALAD
ncbi:MAG: oligopeptide:H+ symporter [Alphaproteobacteria bacterium]|nr:oligopeptide:H+ symporter [Alphaproteobacteria bacterium]MDE2012843.1 oligopeptide:H+ symporter [Alphaproteobacteria bacterium]MDE2073566.1 oligopeptide:H+ symporter [Alphaproteobacteria bacterium]MDE2350539.1 oligopeptide:H+ symporter [Alphaproteobacteria bacterium]